MHDQWLGEEYDVEDENEFMENSSWKSVWTTLAPTMTKSIQLITSYASQKELEEALSNVADLVPEKILEIGKWYSKYNFYLTTIAAIYDNVEAIITLKKFGAKIKYHDVLLAIANHSNRVTDYNAQRKREEEWTPYAESFQIITLTMCVMVARLEESFGSALVYPYPTICGGT